MRSFRVCKSRTGAESCGQMVTTLALLAIHVTSDLIKRYIEYQESEDTGKNRLL